MTMDWSSCASNGVATLSCIPPLIADLIWWLLTFGGVVALFFIIIAGYKYIFSHGDPKKIEEAKRTLSYAILGLVVIFLSFFFVNFIAGITGVACLNTTSAFSFTSCK